MESRKFDFERNAELYELQRNPKTRTVTNLKKPELYEQLDIVVEAVISAIRNEQEYLHEVRNDSEKPNEAFASIHFGFLKSLKYKLTRFMTPVEYEMVLTQDKTIYEDETMEKSEVHNVKDVLKKLAKRMKESIEKGGYILSESEKLMIRQAIAGGVEQVYKLRMEQIGCEAEIANLREQVAELTKKLEEAEQQQLQPEA